MVRSFGVDLTVRPPSVHDIRTALPSLLERDAPYATSEHRITRCIIRVQKNMTLS